MAASDTPLFKSQGKLTSQYYNEETNQWEPIKGRDGANSFIQLGTVAMEAWEKSISSTETFPSNRFGFSAINDGTTNMSFTINGQTRTLKPGDAYEALFEPFTSVIIVASSTYRAEVLK